MKPKTNMMIALLLALTVQVSAQISPDRLNGAWEAINTENMDEQHKAVAIIADGYFSIASYYGSDFESTAGGFYEINGNQVRATFEFNTYDSTMVGQSFSITPSSIQDDRITIEGITWRRLDDGGPGELNGAWLFIGREDNGQINRREPGARKTMKILSGTRFQWIAYNSETGMFSGTGGGTYTTDNGKYTENIEFFSRDSSRVGASLTFDYDIQDNEWHHKGLNSRGEHMYEVWRSREDVMASK